MKRLKLFVIVFSCLLSAKEGYAADRMYTGVITEISASRVELKTFPEGWMSIGFNCEPEVCDTTYNFSIGDDVLMVFGSENRKNKLLSIQLCSEQEALCKEALEIEIRRQEEHDKASKAYEAKSQECYRRVEKDLGDDSRNIPHDNAESSYDKVESVVDEANRVSQDPEKKACIDSLVNGYEAAYLESCQKHDCGQDVAGGCYHLVDNVVTASLLEAVVHECAN